MGYSWPKTYSSRGTLIIFPLYLVICSELVNVVLIREADFGKKSMYFISKALVRLETCHEKIEKTS